MPEYVVDQKLDKSRRKLIRWPHQLCRLSDGSFELFRCHAWDEKTPLRDLGVQLRMALCRAEEIAAQHRQRKQSPTAVGCGIHQRGDETVPLRLEGLPLSRSGVCDI